MALKKPSSFLSKSYNIFIFISASFIHESHNDVPHVPATTETTTEVATATVFTEITTSLPTTQATTEISTQVLTSAAIIEITTKVSTTETSIPCENPLDGICYTLISNQKLNFASAEQYCINNFGGHLAAVISSYIQQHIEGIVSGEYMLKQYC